MKSIFSSKSLLLTLLLLLGVIALIIIVIPEVDNGGKLDGLSVTNINSNSVSILFVTEKDARAGVYYSKKGEPWLPLFPNINKQHASEDFDTEETATGYQLKNQSQGKRKVHLVTLNKLDPDQEYEFKVYSGSKIYTSELNTFSTMPVPEKISAPVVIYGSVYEKKSDPQTITSDKVIQYSVLDSGERSDVRSVAVSEKGTWAGDISRLTSAGKEFMFNPDSALLELAILDGNNTYQATFPLTDYERFPDIFLDETKVLGIQNEETIVAQAEASCIGTCKTGIFGLGELTGQTFNYCANPQSKPYGSRTVCIGSDNACYYCYNGSWQTGPSVAFRCGSLSCSGSNPTPTNPPITSFPSNPSRQACENSGGSWIGSSCVCYSPKINSNGTCISPAPTSNPLQTTCLNSGGSWIGTACVCYPPLTLAGDSCVSRPNPTTDPAQSRCLNSGGSWIGGNSCVCYGGRVPSSSGICVDPTPTANPKIQYCTGSGGLWTGSTCDCGPKTLQNDICIAPPVIKPAAQHSCEQSDGTWSNNKCTCYLPRSFNATTQGCEIKSVQPTPTQSAPTPTQQTNTGKTCWSECTGFANKTTGSVVNNCDLPSSYVIPHASYCRTKPGKCLICNNGQLLETTGCEEIPACAVTPTPQPVSAKYAEEVSVLIYTYFNDKPSGFGITSATITYTEHVPAMGVNIPGVQYSLDSNLMQASLLGGNTTIKLNRLASNTFVTLNTVTRGGISCDRTVQEEKLVASENPTQPASIVFSIHCNDRSVITKGFFGYSDKSLSEEVYKKITDYFPNLRSINFYIHYYNCNTDKVLCNPGALCYVAGSSVFLCNIELLVKLSREATIHAFLHEMTHQNQRIALEKVDAASLDEYLSCRLPIELGAELGALMAHYGSPVCTGSCPYRFDVGDATSLKADAAANKLQEIINPFPVDLQNPTGTATSKILYIAEALSGKDTFKLQQLMAYSNICSISKITGDESSEFNSKQNIIQDKDVQDYINASKKVSLPPGQYTISTASEIINSFEPIVVKVPETASGSAQVSIFNDKNNDGIKQNEEEYISLTSEVTLNKTTDVFTYNLLEGWNMLTFPFENDSFTNAKAALDYFRKEGIPVSSIVKFDDNEFKSYVVKNYDQYFGENFAMTPGLAYFIKSDIAGSITIPGKGKSVDSIQLDKGWNLVSLDKLVGSSKSNSQALLNSCKSSATECDIITKYDSGRYESQILENGLLYGNSFNFLTKNGYFIRAQKSGEFNLAQ